MENQKPQDDTPQESNSVAKAADAEKPLSDTELENGGRKAGAIPYIEVQIKEVIVTTVSNSVGGAPTNK
jgi:hypothetical protein